MTLNSFKGYDLKTQRKYTHKNLLKETIQCTKQIQVLQNSINRMVLNDLL